MLLQIKMTTQLLVEFNESIYAQLCKTCFLFEQGGLHIFSLDMLSPNAATMIMKCCHLACVVLIVVGALDIDAPFAD